MTSPPKSAGGLMGEAEVIASLNRPNVAAVYGIEEGPAALDSAQAGKAGHYVLAGAA